MTITYGTLHFVDFLSAIDYYRLYGFNSKDVRQKLADGEIHVGKPSIKEGELLILVDNGQRYAIQEI